MNKRQAKKNSLSKKLISKAKFIDKMFRKNIKLIPSNMNYTIPLDLKYQEMPDI